VYGIEDTFVFKVFLNFKNPVKVWGNIKIPANRTLKRENFAIKSERGIFQRRLAKCPPEGTA
jgi:hypothetical protein